MRYIVGAAIGLTLVVLHHNSPTVDEALGGSWWWWLLLAVVLVCAIRFDLRSSRKPPAERGKEG